VRRLFLVVLTLVVAGCATNSEAVAPAKKPSRTCSAAGVPGFRTCRHLPYPTQPTIERHQTLMWQIGDLMHRWEKLQSAKDLAGPDKIVI